MIGTELAISSYSVIPPAEIATSTSPDVISGGFFPYEPITAASIPSPSNPNRGKIFQKIAREIQVAAKGTNGIPEENPALRVVIEKARAKPV